MKLVKLQCPSCGGAIRIKKGCELYTCEFCGTQAVLQKDTEVVERPQTVETNRQSATEKRKTWLWVLGWICIFPLPLTILLLRNKTLDKTLRYGLIVAAWIVYLLIAAGGSDEPTVPDPAGTASTVCLQNTETVTFDAR